MDLVAQWEAFAYSTLGGLFAFYFGTLWGSFANVCIYRWPPTDEFPQGRSVVAPGSHCFVCKTPIRWYDNVPLLSFLWLRGKCRACKTGFSTRYLWVEALTGLLFVGAWLCSFWLYPELTFGARAVRFFILAAFTFLMVVVTFIDIDHRLILNKVTYPSVPLAYGAGLLLGRAWWEGLLGAAVGYCGIWLIAEVYLRLRKREGMGMGDAKLLAVIGALMGWRGVAAGLFGGSMLGAVFGVGMLLWQRRGRSGNEDLATAEIPFGPYIAAAALLYLFFEKRISLELTQWITGHAPAEALELPPVRVSVPR